MRCARFHAIVRKNPSFYRAGGSPLEPWAVVVQAIKKMVNP